MEAVLYVAHGSRVKAGVEEAKHFIERAKQKVNIKIQEMCFLELAQPSILEGIESCITKGATKISVIPILLLSANHAKQDIPLEISKAKSLYPSVSFTLGKPLGVHDKILDSLHERIKVKTTVPIEEIEVLLIGRGSSDLEVQDQLQQIADNLKGKFHYGNVSTCFLYGNGPSFEETLQQLIDEKRKQVYIIPYLLFSGLLARGIQKKIAQQQFQKGHVVLCDSLGYDDNVLSVLIERVKETLISWRVVDSNG